MKTLTLDINLAQQCNLRCKYCAIDFDNPKILNFKLTDTLVDKVQFLLQNPKFFENFSNIQISFFGGEPTLNLKSIQKITKAFENNHKVSFFIYSNGYKYKPEVFELLEHFKNYRIQNNPKLLTQISYDGLASHNVDRVTKTNKESALEVKKTIFELRERGIPFIVHPTISAKNFDKISENYFEFKRMSNILEMGLTYSPTIDYLTHYKFSKSELSKLKETLKIEFNKISKSCLDFYNNFGIFDFGWFNDSKAICGAGDGYFGIDISGEIKPCHGTFGNNRERYVLGNLNSSNEEFLDSILKWSPKFGKTIRKLPKECQNCKTHYCLKCNAAKAENSKHKELLDGWVDYTSQPSLCEIYKFIGLYRIALLNAKINTFS